MCWRLIDSNCGWHIHRAFFGSFGKQWFDYYMQIHYLHWVISYVVEALDIYVCISHIGWISSYIFSYLCAMIYRNPSSFCLNLSLWSLIVIMNVLMYNTCHSIVFFISTWHSIVVAGWFKIWTICTFYIYLFNSINSTF